MDGVNGRSNQVVLDLVVRDDGGNVVQRADLQLQALEKRAQLVQRSLQSVGSSHAQLGRQVAATWGVANAALTNTHATLTRMVPLTATLTSRFGALGVALGAVAGGFAAVGDAVRGIGMADALRGQTLALEAQLRAQGRPIALAGQTTGALQNLYVRTGLDQSMLFSSGRMLTAQGIANPQNVIERLSNLAVAGGQDPSSVVPGLVNMMGRAEDRLQLPGRLINLLERVDPQALHHIAPQMGMTPDELSARAQHQMVDPGQFFNEVMRYAGQFNGLVETMQTRSLGGLIGTMHRAFDVNILTTFGKGFLDSVLGPVERADGPLSRVLRQMVGGFGGLGDTFEKLGTQVGDFLGPKIEQAFAILQRPEALGQRMVDLWNEVILQPFNRWWAGGGQEQVTRVAATIGPWLAQQMATFLGIALEVDMGAAGIVGRIGAAAAAGFVAGFVDQLAAKLPTWLQGLLGVHPGAATEQAVAASRRISADPTAGLNTVINKALGLNTSASAPTAPADASATVAQFNNPAMANRLRASGFSEQAIADMCAPIALAGFARVMGKAVDPADVAAEMARNGDWAPGVGATNRATSAANELRRLGLAPEELSQADAMARLRSGQPVIINTPGHYLLGQGMRPGGIYVGESGRAFAGGSDVMSLADIERLGHGQATFLGGTGDPRTMASLAAQRYGIPEMVFLRQIEEESHFNPAARSAAGALGIAQFMPGTAAGFGIDPMNPAQALDAAARYDAENLRKFGSVEKMLRAYNAGPGGVDASYGYAETNKYVRDILGAGQQYVQAGNPGDPAVVVQPSDPSVAVTINGGVNLGVLSADQLDQRTADRFGQALANSTAQHMASGLGQVKENSVVGSSP